MAALCPPELSLVEVPRRARRPPPRIRVGGAHVRATLRRAPS